MSPTSTTGHPIKRRASEPTILDGVRDRNGDRWIRFGTHARSVWFSIGELISTPSTVFQQVLRTGGQFVTRTSQDKFKRDVEARTDFREALVAPRPGWHDGFYVFGDGYVERPPSDGREVIVTFVGSSKFSPQGAFNEWRDGVAPFVADQPLLYFLAAYALVGPLMRFVPPGYLNPQVEISGPGETGKTIAGVFAASVWAGDPDSDVGGGETWDTTINALDELKQSRRDGFLFLDEGNLAGHSLRERREVARQAVFKTATTSGKRRMGDPAEGEHARFAFLSTTNTPLKELLADTADVASAAQSRMITLRIDHSSSHGIFRTVPVDYPSSRAASEALRETVDRYWGSAGAAFVEMLVRQVEYNESALRRVIATELERIRRRSCSISSSARVQKTFALIEVAALLAVRWRIFDEQWGKPAQLIRAVAVASAIKTSSNSDDPLFRIRAYMEASRNGLKDVASLEHPLRQNQFDGCAGFIRGSGRDKELLVPSSVFQRAFPDHVNMVRLLREANCAKTEGGRETKLTIKSPRSICLSGRVYCIRVG